MNRLVCWFSCGAASAVATKMIIEENNRSQNPLPLVVAYTEIKQEHPDNKRFLKECEEWFGIPIQILRNDEYLGDTDEVFIRTQFLVGPKGAACTRLLKKQVRKDFQEPGDIQVFGYTVEEQDRYDRFLDSNNIRTRVPLIDYQLTKDDCLAVIAKAGIEIPTMYKLGYKNNNCIGCVKGGMGYWNKIRVDFPERFQEMIEIEEFLGRTVNKERDGTRIKLKDLDPNRGRYEYEPDIECGIVCYSAFDQMTSK